MSLFQCWSKKPNLPEVGGWVGELQLFAPTSPPSRSLSSLWLSAAVIYLFMYVVKKVCVVGGGRFAEDTQDLLTKDWLRCYVLLY